MNIENLIKSINYANIESDTNFWLVRTKGGLFYEEFINNKFIALGWNVITKRKISSIESVEDENNIKDIIAKKYNKTKIPGYPLGQSKRFIYNLNKGDIVIIPDKGTNNIAFGVLQNYYEDNSFNYQKELDFINLIDNDWKEVFDIPCPYIKRWKVKWIKTMDYKKINPNLYPVFSSRHGISNIIEYIPFVLSSMYEIYFWNNSINYVFHSKKVGKIKAIDISKFISSNAYIAEELFDITDLSAKINLNSPGDFTFSISCLTENLPQLLCNILVIWIMICGGSFKTPIFSFKISSILDYILKFREQNNKFKNDELARKIKEHELEIRKSADNLQIDKDRIHNVIDFYKFSNKNDE